MRCTCQDRTQVSDVSDGLVSLFFVFWSCNSSYIKARPAQHRVVLLVELVEIHVEMLQWPWPELRLHHSPLEATLQLYL